MADVCRRIGRLDVAPRSASSFARAKRELEAGYLRRLLETTEGPIAEVSRRGLLARHRERLHRKRLGRIP